MVAKSKLNSIEALISQALIDMDISHEELVTILKKKDRHEMMKDNLRIKMENSMKLWDLIVWNQRFRKIKNSEILLNIVFVINKNLFFVYI